MSKRSRRAERPPTARAPVADTPSRWWPLAVVFLIAVAVRLLVAAEVWDLPLVRTPKLDSAEYLSWARRLAAGDFAWPILSPHGPGYPFYLAALLVLGSGSLKAAIAVQAVVGAVTAVMLAAIAREWFGLRAGLVAAIVYALYGPAVYVETALLSEGLLLCLLTFSTLMLCRERVTRPRAALAGAALGLATLVRPTAVVFALGYGLWLLLRKARATAVIVAAMCILTVAPAVAKTWSVSRSLSVQGYGGLNFYIGNSPLHDGRPTFRLGSGWDALNADALHSGASDPAAQDRYYLEKTFGEVRQHPAAFVKLLGAKLLWLVQSEEVRDSHSFYFFADRAPLLRVLPRWTLLFPAACVGAIVLMARLKPRSTSERSASPQASRQLLLTYAAAAAATTVFLVMGTRYRLPLVPALAIAAGAGSVALVDSVVARGTRDLVLYGAAIAGAIVVSHLATDPRNVNLAEEWALTGSSLITERNLPEAEAAYRRALALDPQSGLAWDGLGLVQYDAGRLPDARQALSRAIALGGENAHALFHLALVDEREGKLADAAAGYRRAADLSPYDADMTRHLATALGMTGRSADALEQMRRVVQLDPGNGDAWLDVCLLSLDVRDVAAAAAALQRARELGAPPQRLAFAADALNRARQ